MRDGQGKSGGEVNAGPGGGRGAWGFVRAVGVSVDRDTVSGVV